MLSGTKRKLIGAATVVVVALAGLAPTVFAPAQAGTSRPTAPGPVAPAEPMTETAIEVEAFSVPEAQQAISSVLAASGAASAWPAVDADLTPQLHEAVALGGDALSVVFAWQFRITIHCEITFPPLRIRCWIQIQFAITSTSETPEASSVPELQQAISDVLAVNGAAQAWPAVDAELTPLLHQAFALSADVQVEIRVWRFKITITCKFKLFRIKCKVRVSRA